MEQRVHPHCSSAGHLSIPVPFFPLSRHTTEEGRRSTDIQRCPSKWGRCWVARWVHSWTCGCILTGGCAHRCFLASVFCAFKAGDITSPDGGDLTDDFPFFAPREMDGIFASSLAALCDLPMLRWRTAIVGDREGLQLARALSASEQSAQIYLLGPRNP